VPQFPIRYGQNVPPPGQTSVRANLDTDTGAGMIGRALQGAGSQMVAFAEKLKEAKDVVGDAEYKLKADGIRDST